ncbi:unnamed protein product [marine sediment metagenome]|uniref:Replication factor C C-terminal domain-containing protein n=1 Tax=marine sediment metagenome TaxID=412755 RepID=X1N353_9ZZZZ
MSLYKLTSPVNVVRAQTIPSMAIKIPATNKKITTELLHETLSITRSEDVKTLINTALDGHFMPARNQLYNLLIKHGLSGEDIIRQMQQNIFDLTIPDENKVQLIEKTGETEFRLIRGNNEHIQLESLLAQIVLMGEQLKDFSSNGTK